MLRTNIDLTRHAVERYQQRHAPALTFDEVSDLLTNALPSAVKLPDPSMGRRGGTQWQLQNPCVVLVTQLDPGAEKHVCVTILPARTSQGFKDDELHILEAAEETRARLVVFQQAAAAAAEQRKEAQARVKDPSISNRVRHDVETQAQHAKKASADAHHALELAKLQATEIIEREKTIRLFHDSREKTIRIEHTKRTGKLNKALRIVVRQMLREGSPLLVQVQDVFGEMWDLEEFATCHGHWPLDMLQKPEAVSE